MRRCSCCDLHYVLKDNYQKETITDHSTLTMRRCIKLTIPVRKSAILNEVFPSIQFFDFYLFMTSITCQNSGSCPFANESPLIRDILNGTARNLICKTIKRQELKQICLEKTSYGLTRFGLNVGSVLDSLEFLICGEEIDLCVA